MREDQDAERARGLDEAGGGDRLAGRGRMPEPVAPDRTGVFLGRQRLLVLVGIVVALGERLVVLLVVGRLVDGGVVPVAVPVLLLALRRGDQLGEHAGERVDLVPAERRPRGGVRLRLAEYALEPEHERVVHLPARARPGIARVHLRDRVVQGAATGAP